MTKDSMAVSTLNFDPSRALRKAVRSPLAHGCLGGSPDCSTWKKMESCAKLCRWRSHLQLAMLALWDSRQGWAARSFRDMTHYLCNWHMGTVGNLNQAFRFQLHKVWNILSIFKSIFGQLFEPSICSFKDSQDLFLYILWMCYWYCHLWNNFFVKLLGYPAPACPAWWPCSPPVKGWTGGPFSKWCGTGRR